MGRILTEKDVEAAVRGGSVYAAGGGGWADHGRMLGTAAVTDPALVPAAVAPLRSFIHSRASCLFARPAVWPALR